MLSSNYYSLNAEAMTIADVKNKIKFYNDFPKEGILFIDLLPLLSDSEIFSFLIHRLGKLITSPNLAAPEARGFLFATPLMMLPAGIKTIAAFRKTGKLPHSEGDLVRIPIIKEYGDDSIFFRKSDVAAAYPTLSNEPVIEMTVFDDVLATGGTAEGMAHALNTLTLETIHGSLPVRVREFVFLTEITALNARQRLEKIAQVKTLIAF